MDSPPTLPLEIIIHILKFVSLSDRKQARLVCRQWYHASQDPHFVRQELVDIQHNNDITDLINSTRRFEHFVFVGSDFNWKMSEFSDHYGHCLKSISLWCCDIHERQFIDLLSCCPRLEALKICGCRELLMSGRLLSDERDIHFLKSILVNVKELSIQNNSYLSDALFNRFIAICPHLESLSLDGCQVSFHQGLCRKFYPTLEDESTLASSSILTFQNIFNFVSKNYHQIRRLSFSKTIIDSKALSQLAQVANLRLESLHLSRCEQLTNRGVISLSDSQPYLQHLDLSYSTRVTDVALIAICDHLNQLKHLNLQSCGWLTDLSVLQFYKLKTLVSLNLSHCKQVTGEGILSGVCAPCHSADLRQLFLSGISSMTPDVVIHLAGSLPQLRHLDLSYCHTAVTDLAIQAIFQHLIWLRCLQVSGCDKITDAGLTGMGMGMGTGTSTEATPSAPTWPKISLRSRAEEEIVQDARRKTALLQMGSDDMVSGNPTGYSLARLKGLTTLCLRGCSRISDVSLLYAFRLLELKLVVLSQCHQVTHAGLKSLSENNPSIESFYLDQCHGVTDDAVNMLVRNLPRLRVLALQGCQKLSVQSVMYIDQHCKSLRHLDMRNCNGVKGASHIALKNVREFFPPANSESHHLPPPLPPPLPDSLSLPR